MPNKVQSRSIPVVILRPVVLTGLAFASLLGVADQAAGEVTFAKDIAPILQRACQSCHRPNALAPMSLITYEEVRPWARSIKYRTGLRDTLGVMPPWFLEEVGIRQFKDDMSLSEDEITTIAQWVDSGAPRGHPADMPPPLAFGSPDEWAIGEPDLVVETVSKTIAANAPDWWGVLPPVPTGVTEDRYVAKMQLREVNDVAGTVSGQFVFHHANYSVLDEDGIPTGMGGWPTVHDLRNNPSGFTFDPEAGRLLPAQSQLQYDIVHLHANGKEDAAAHLEVAFIFHPKDYQPTKRIGAITFGTREIDLLPMQSDQQLHFYRTLEENVKLMQFGPHMHAAGVRMCLEVIWGGRVETLNCSGYDHNWLQYYRYADDAAPLLPKGAILHGIGYFDNTATNPNVADPRNWSGVGHRAIDNMLIAISPAFILTDEEFEEEMAARRQRLQLADGETVLGCPLCGTGELPAGRARRLEGGQ